MIESIDKRAVAPRRIPIHHKGISHGLPIPQGLIFAEEKIEFSDSSVKLFQGKGKAVREIAFADVSAIHGFSNMTAVDETGQTFDTHMCRIAPRKGRAITICSTTFPRNGPGHRQVATNNAVGYIKFIDRIKRDVAGANPEAVLIDGHRLASVMGYFVAAVSIGVLGLAAVAAFSGNSSITETWPLLLVGGLIGLVFAP